MTEFAERDRIALAKTSWAEDLSTARAEDTHAIRIKFMSAVGAVPQSRLYFEGRSAKHVPSPVRREARPRCVATREEIEPSASSTCIVLR